MSGPGFSRRELKLQAKRTLARWAKPCLLAAAALLLFTLLLEVVQATTPGTSLSYFFLSTIEDYPIQTGAWTLDGDGAARLMKTIGLPAEFGAAGAFLAALRVDAAEVVYLLVIPFRQIPVALLVQLVVLLLSTPILYGVLQQFWHVLKGQPLPFRHIFSWYLDLRLTAKAVALQLVLELWRTVTSLVCMIPGMTCTILGSQTGSPDFLVLLALPLAFLGMLLGYYCYTLLLPAQYLLARSPELSAREALTQSWQMLRGSRRWFFWLQVSFLLWHLLSMSLYQVADLYVLPYQHLTSMLFLLVLENSARAERNGPDVSLL